ncbi:MAG: ABC transporter ATP-binding protein [Candidatus Aenigmarchaeota archaeon CG_4_10_14_0_8_um_filter_37_24]|nr:ATP-binding cassette domain-containing protein [Candidatus Aenigmarchaeota archaeon]OIN85259.1 MAG: ABC transporter ATP-binding protein [Candidatus Aenigmarchaeota archaeon CG1_02_38_14]PIV68011.1 MAG: ABC transporter ATP-binding protein [Candidatus Aenigmarchaeota archaeon CG01_land_8_20_14_3_00_37_9]PIW40995.1 MAG: ABC transporter ATP-binding protein [Candidatus Aenigmarchaeota archaeon CG15_BIG_FIL_POST_REV_8_21_14_020_37_27]PIX50260.1 MAG: ABC transporter ATP-binding protein [Candidatus 
MNVIEVKNLSKTFSHGIKAVDSVTFNVEKGEIFGFLGPNGAGKTTTINMLCTLLKSTSGDGKICGYDIASQHNQVRECIGLVFQDMTLDDQLTARENLELHARLYGVPDRKKRIDQVLEIVELRDRENSIVKTFSGGMQRRLEIARGLIHYPKVLFLDEPTLGLDPQTRKHVWDYIVKLKKEYGMTIFLTTHYMEEADELCDRIAVIDHGKIIALDTSKKLKDSLGGDTIILDLNDRDVAKALKIFKDAKRFDGQIILSVKNAGKQIEEVLEKCRKNKIEVVEANIRKPTLNDVFLKLTGREIREETVGLKEQLKRGEGFRMRGHGR